MSDKDENLKELLNMLFPDEIERKILDGIIEGKEVKEMLDSTMPLIHEREMEKKLKKFLEENPDGETN